MLSCKFRYNYLLFCRSFGYTARNSYSYQEGAADLVFAHLISFQNGVGDLFFRNKVLHREISYLFSVATRGKDIDVHFLLEISLKLPRSSVIQCAILCFQAPHPVPCL